jgi:hypothetical protein
MSHRFIPGAAALALVLWLGAGSARGTAPKKRHLNPLPQHPPEWVIRFWDIVVGQNVTGAAASPLARSKSRLGWLWLARQHGLPAGGKLLRKDFKGPRELFDRLDRDGDGVLDAGDFDWSANAPFVCQQSLATALFNRLNRDGDGQVSAKE